MYRGGEAMHDDRRIIELLNQRDEQVLQIIQKEQQDLVYIRLNPDGSENEWYFLYPAKQNQEQSFNSAITTRIYTLFNDIADGDVNADGTFSVADAVLLQKWLLASPDTSLANWKAADFNKDNQINAIDFTLMKRALIEAVKK